MKTPQECLKCDLFPGDSGCANELECSFNMEENIDKCCPCPAGLEIEPEHCLVCLIVRDNIATQTATQIAMEVFK